MSASDFKKFRKSRLLRKRGKNIPTFKKLNRYDMLLVYNRNTKRIMAEYEVVDMGQTSGQIKVKAEPIYIAPPKSGIQINSSTIPFLNRFQTVQGFLESVRQQLTEIPDSDYQFLGSKLKN